MQLWTHFLVSSQQSSSSQRFTDTQQVICDSYKQFLCTERESNTLVVGVDCGHREEVSWLVIHSPDGAT